MSGIVSYSGPVSYLSGQTAPGADVAEQTQGVLDKIEALLKNSGTSREKVLSATIYLAEMSDFSDFDDIRDTWFPADATPARTAVEANLTRPEVRVEITVTAAG